MDNKEKYANKINLKTGYREKEKYTQNLQSKTEKKKNNQKADSL